MTGEDAYWAGIGPEDFADDEAGEEYCSHCGKAFEDFSDLGCGFCDRRSPEWEITNG